MIVVALRSLKLQRDENLQSQRRLGENGHRSPAFATKRTLPQTAGTSQAILGENSHIDALNPAQQEPNFPEYLHVLAGCQALTYQPWLRGSAWHSLRSNRPRPNPKGPLRDVSSQTWVTHQRSPLFLRDWPQLVSCIIDPLSDELSTYGHLPLWMTSSLSRSRAAA